MSARAIAVAARRSAAYGHVMPVSRLLRLLTLLAMLLAPVTMMHGRGMAASAAPNAGPHHAAAPRSSDRDRAIEGRCADRDDRSGKHGRPSPDCAIACAALPASAGRLPAPAITPALLAPAPLFALGHGLAPEAATPPPRGS